MVIDCHVHIAACTLGHGSLSLRLQGKLAFRFMRWRFALKGYDEQTERTLESVLARAIDGAEKLDKAVVLAFDRVYDNDGRPDEANTHLYVTNDYVMDLAARHPKVLFGASVHPYRRDAVAEVERCWRAGAALVKWLPIVQNFDPSDDRCIPLYEFLAHHELPLLCHTGGEHSLPAIAPQYADPMLLVPALKRGVTVICAHCGTRSMPWERDYVLDFMRLAQTYENCYGDTAALNLPTRSHAWDYVLRDRAVRRKLVHGSDWPIPCVPPMWHVGPVAAARLMTEGNSLRRDVLAKERLGLEDEYWHRAGTILRLPETAATTAGPAGAAGPAR